jgi:uncharacterized repeat protein (TIGR03803 family)
MFPTPVRLTLLFLAAYVLNTSAYAQTYTVTYKFVTTRLSGAHPAGALIQDASGNLYGTTTGGGSARLGTVFKLDPNGVETVLHSFTGDDGAHPAGSLTLDEAGNIYGTTRIGGASDLGTVFKLDPDGNLSLLHSFQGGTDGAQPRGSLIRDAAGNLYGTTFFGGFGGRGTVFKIDALGNESVIHAFQGVPFDGAYPAADLVQDAAGNLYGTTKGGGLPVVRNNGVKAGTIFRVTPGGQETVIYDFTQFRGTGFDPRGGLILDQAGNLYGTTRSTDRGSGLGVVYKFDLNSNALTVLHKFDGTDGGRALGGLVRDGAGNLYGTTSSFPSCVCGTVFKLDPNNVLTVLHTFTGNPDGRRPFASLLMDSANNLYGTTLLGGYREGGTIFKIAP